MIYYIAFELFPSVAYALTATFRAIVFVPLPCSSLWSVAIEKLQATGCENEVAKWECRIESEPPFYFRMLFQVLSFKNLNCTVSMYDYFLLSSIGIIPNFQRNQSGILL